MPACFEPDRLTGYIKSGQEDQWQVDQGPDTVADKRLFTNWAGQRAKIDALGSR